MKKIIFAVISLLMLFSFTACQSTPESSDHLLQESAPSSDGIVLRLAEIHAQDYPHTQAALEFSRIVKEKTDGRIIIEVYYGGQLGDEASVAEQVQFGAIDFARISSSPLAEYVDDLNTFQLPYLWSDSDHMWRVLNSSIGDNILASLEKGNFVGLSWYDSGARSFYASYPIYSMSDVIGKKIRVMQSQLMMDMIEFLNASPVAIPSGEIYSALQTGIVDAAENCFPGYMMLGHNEVAKYFTFNEHLMIPDITIASKITMNKLSSEDQQIIKDAAKEASLFQREKWKEVEESCLETAKASGIEFIEIDEAARNEFIEAVQPLYDRLTEEQKVLVEQIKKS